MTSARKTIGLLSLAVLALALLVAQPAFAAGNAVTYYDVRSVALSDGSRGLLVGAEIASSVKLPAEVRLSVPKTAKLNWVGELLGGDPSKDPTAKYRTEPGGSDFDVLVVTATQARRVQAEVSLPAPVAGSDGTRVGISWQAPEPADSAQLAIEIPAGAQVASASAGASPVSVSGSSFYVKQFSSLKKGTRADLSLVYSGGAATGQQAPQQQAPQQQAPQQTTNNAPGQAPSSPFVVVIVLGLILAGTFYMLDRVRPRPQPATEGAPARRTQKKD